MPRNGPDLWGSFVKFETEWGHSVGMNGGFRMSTSSYEALSQMQPDLTQK